MDKIEKLLDDMIDAIISNDEILMRESEQTIWRLGANLSEVCEPSIENPLKYVLKACLIKEMNNVWRSKGGESFDNPEWAVECFSLPVPYSVISIEDLNFWINEECNKTFIAHNIYAPEKYLNFY